MVPHTHRCTSVHVGLVPGHSRKALTTYNLWIFEPIVGQVTVTTRNQVLGEKLFSSPKHQILSPSELAKKRYHRQKFDAKVPAKSLMQMSLGRDEKKYRRPLFLATIFFLAYLANSQWKFFVTNHFRCQNECKLAKTFSYMKKWSHFLASPGTYRTRAFRPTKLASARLQPTTPHSIFILCWKYLIYNTKCDN